MTISRIINFLIPTGTIYGFLNQLGGLGGLAIPYIFENNWRAASIMNWNLYSDLNSMHKLITGIIYPAQNSNDGTCIVLADAQTHLPALFYQQDCKVIKGPPNTAAVDKWFKDSAFTNSKNNWINNGFTKNKNISKSNVDKIMQDHKWVNDLRTYNPCYNISKTNSFSFNL